jgi:hypothetical protein
VRKVKGRVQQRRRDCAHHTHACASDPAAVLVELVVTLRSTAAARAREENLELEVGEPGRDQVRRRPRFLAGSGRVRRRPETGQRPGSWQRGQADGG